MTRFSPLFLWAGLLVAVAQPAARAQLSKYVEGAPVETQMFGVGDEGTRFVYVVDRSGSTDDPPGHDVLSAAKSQLLSSLNDLNRGHQFQIIFYNDAPRLLQVEGREGRLLFATAENKEAAAKFVASIRAGGGTDHHAALAMAIRMQPDVIFLLTDGDRPKLSPHELDHLQRLAKGIHIHCIQFGPAGGAPAEFLQQLARQNDGKYKYVDVAKLPSAR